MSRRMRMTTDCGGLAPVALLFSLALAGCGEPAGGDDHGHAHAPGGGHVSEDAGHAHEDEGRTLVYTDYSETTELFLEFSPLVAGETVRFAAHVTRLVDAAPLTSGQLDVLLKDGERTVARFRVTEVARAGLFTPAVTPRDAGQFRLQLAVRDGELEALHDLGRVTVFASADEVRVDQAGPEGEITYLKEQQWGSPFAAVPVARRALRPSVPGFATVRAPADAGAEVRAPSDGYFANADTVRAGDSIEAGDLLAYLVPRLGGETDFGQLLVARERARSELALARRDVERLVGLYEQGAIPERRLVEAREALEVARTEYQTAQARLDQQRQGNADAGIALRAPVGGEVVEVMARPGAFVKAGERVVRIASRERRWLEVEVPERFAAGLRDASGAWFDTAEGETVVLDEANGSRVVQTGTAVDPVKRTARVTIEYLIDQGPDLIGARLPAHVFIAAPEPRLAVPRSAVIDDGGRPVVYVQTGGETFQRRPVELGVVAGEYVEVLVGVSAGERVVSKGAYFVKLAATGGEEIGHGHAH